jgi:hypothetical protein
MRAEMESGHASLPPDPVTYLKYKYKLRHQNFVLYLFFHGQSTLLIAGMWGKRFRCLQVILTVLEGLLHRVEVYILIHPKSRCC